jgi:hypothetical protein
MNLSFFVQLTGRAHIDGQQSYGYWRFPQEPKGLVAHDQHLWPACDATHLQTSGDGFVQSMTVSAS